MGCEYQLRENICSFGNNFIINDLGLNLVRTINRAGFICIPVISPDPLFLAFDIKFL